MSDTVKVSFSCTVEVDREAWELEYGTEGVAALREDVKQYIGGLVDDGTAGCEFWTVTSWR